MLHIRRAEPDDLGAIAEIHYEAWTMAYRSIFSPGELNWGSLDAREEKWRAELQKAGHGNYIAAEQGAIVGFFTLISDAAEGARPGALELRSIYFAPLHWRKGFGTQCLSFILAKAKQEGYKSLLVWILEENQTMAAFLQKLGFTSDGSKKVVGEQIALTEILYQLAL